MDWIKSGFVLATMMVTLSSSQYTAADYAVWMRIAARAGDANYVRSVLNTGLVPVDSADPNGFNSLHWACRFGRLSVVTLLVNSPYNAQIDIATTATGETAIISAAMGNFVEIAKVLMAKNADLNKQENYGYTALALAAKLGHLDYVKLLLENNANYQVLTTSGQTPLILASSGNHVDIMKLLHEAGDGINAQDSEGYTGVIWASRNGHTEAVTYLTSQGADVLLITNTGDTALMWGALGNHLEVVKILLENGAMVDTKEEDGWTALMGASVQGHEEMVTLLLASNASSNVTNEKGHTALTVASAMGHEEVADLLTDEDSELINHQDEKQMTALVHAAANNFTYTFLVIAYKCPDITIADEDGKTAMDYAVQNNNQVMIRSLNFMANPYCTRFGVKYNEGDQIYQDCEILECHCTSVWRYSGEKDTECGKGKKQILTLQRAHSPIFNKRMATHVVR